MKGHDQKRELHASNNSSSIVCCNQINDAKQAWPIALPNEPIAIPSPKRPGCMLPSSLSHREREKEQTAYCCLHSGLIEAHFSSGTAACTDAQTRWDADIKHEPFSRTTQIDLLSISLHTGTTTSLYLPTEQQQSSDQMRSREESSSQKTVSHPDMNFWLCAGTRHGWVPGLLFCLSFYWELIEATHFTCKLNWNFDGPYLLCGQNICLYLFPPVQFNLYIFRKNSEAKVD